LAEESLAQSQQVEFKPFSSQIGPQQCQEQVDQPPQEPQIYDLQMLLEAQQKIQELESHRASAQRLADSLTSRFEAAQKKIEALQDNLSSYQTTSTDLESQLQRHQAALATQQSVITALQKHQAPESEKNQVIQGLSKNLLDAHSKIEALETEFSSQLMLQAKLQHACQELDVQRHLYQERVGHLEQQVAEMQEQILKQAQQASEYEAAVQHWKDQCLNAEHQVLQLKAVLEQLLKDRNFPELTTAATTVEAGKDPELVTLDAGEAEPLNLLKVLKIDFPAFLNLRRHPKP
ncbi:MAG TPA: hypothetical protein V6D03_00785, partial [Candidatus Caenarcaniphilales bacterium]